MSRGGEPLAWLAEALWPEFAPGHNEISLLSAGFLGHGMLTALAARHLSGA
jgi:hypothetical protein